MFALRWTVIDNLTIMCVYVCLCESTRVPSAHRTEQNKSQLSFKNFLSSALRRVRKTAKKRLLTSSCM